MYNICYVKKKCDRYFDSCISCFLSLKLQRNVIPITHVIFTSLIFLPLLVNNYPASVPHASVSVPLWSHRQLSPDHPSLQWHTPHSYIPLWLQFVLFGFFKNTMTSNYVIAIILQSQQSIQFINLLSLLFLIKEMQRVVFKNIIPILA